MSGSNRSTQGGQHGTRGDAQGAHFMQSLAEKVLGFRAPGAGDVEPGSQEAAKPVLVPVSCSGPTGPCVLEMGHPGDHQRPVVEAQPVSGSVFTEVERLRLENEDMRACLRVAGMLLRGVESYGNPGHSFRQDTADRCERLAR